MEIVSYQKRRKYSRTFEFQLRKAIAQTGCRDFSKPRHMATGHILCNCSLCNLQGQSCAVHCGWMTTALYSGCAGWVAQEWQASPAQSQQGQCIQDVSNLSYCEGYTRPCIPFLYGWVKHTQADHIHWTCSAKHFCFSSRISSVEISDFFARQAHLWETEGKNSLKRGSSTSFERQN